MTPTLNLVPTSTHVLHTSPIMSPISTYMLDTSCRASIVQILDRVPVFAAIDSTTLTELANAMELVSVDKGTELVTDKSRSMFMIVVQGLVHVVSATQSWTLNPYDYFGFKSLFDDQIVSTCSVVSDTNSAILTLTYTKFQQILHTSPHLALAFLPVLAQHTPDTLATTNTIASPIHLSHHQNNNKPVSNNESITIAIFDAKPYQVKDFVSQNALLKYNYTLKAIDQKLSLDTVDLAKGAHAVCVFVHDSVSLAVVKELKQMGIGLVLYRCAGYELCDVNACDQNQVSVCRVPGYSPNAIAEHAVALMLALNRKLVWANQRVHVGDFSLDGLVGFDMKDKTVGVIGTGRIGACLVQIMLGFGCKVLCFDVYKNLEVVDRVQYVDLPTLYKESDIISLHAPLTTTTFHMINAAAISQMKRGVMLINTSRGPLIETLDLIDALKSGHVGSCGLDVIEGEQQYFYKDCSHSVITNDQIARLLAFQTNVIITAHQAFLTNEALSEIASITLHNVNEYVQGKRMKQLTNSINQV